MPTHIKIIHTHEFIKVTPEGLLDLDGTRELMAAVASAAEPLDNHEILLDTRKVHSELSADDLKLLAIEVGKFRQAFSCKTAILCPLERFNMAHFFAIITEIKGYEVGVYTSFEEAMEWLIMDQTEVTGNA